MDDDSQFRLFAYRVAKASGMPLLPATKGRSWVESTTHQFARRCLPLLIANQAGWFIMNAQTIHATWNGGDDPRSLHVEYEESDGPHAAMSHFGHGILTWSIPYLFRTPPGVNLLVRGPSNWPKDGVSPLEGIVEADWAVATFTMNWKVTRANVRVTFEAGEPICMLVPQRRHELEQFLPMIADIDSEPELAREYAMWQRSRGRFLAELGAPGSEATQVGWQRHYFRGETPTGLRATEHQLSLRLKAFTEEEDINKEGAQGMEARRPHPQVAKYAREISQKTRYPIRNFGQLVAALGGERATIEFENWRAPVARLREFIPDHYFPVTSEEDLLNKAEDLRAQYMAAQGRGEAPAEAGPDFSDFPRRDLDVSRIELPAESQAQAGVGRLPDD